MKGVLIMQIGTQVPSSTYRVQLRSEFTFADLIHQLDYLQELGIDTLYLSSVLQAEPGSTHGYNVVNPTIISSDLGGEEGLASLAAQVQARGMHIIIDIVPNHQGFPRDVQLNPTLWQLLTYGPESECAKFYDVDWELGGNKIILPFLGSSIEDCIQWGLVRVERLSNGSSVLKLYHGDDERTFPIKAGTENLPLRDLLDAQYYRFGDWREGPGYRRFFNVNELIGVQVEHPQVFRATVTPLLEILHTIDPEGKVFVGLRCDHIDGVANPKKLLDDLTENWTQLWGEEKKPWVIVEKILEGNEQLPDDWKTAGDTGYKALEKIDKLFIDPQSVEKLRELYIKYTQQAEEFSEVVTAAKIHVLTSILYPEVHRLMRLAHNIPQLNEAPEDSVRTALVQLLIGMQCYRSYSVPGQIPSKDSLLTIEKAYSYAQGVLSDDESALTALHILNDILVSVSSDPIMNEFTTRFNQAAGPLMAKAKEDQAFYLHTFLVALKEVGGDPDQLAINPDELTAFAQTVLEKYPATMTTLNTHDTKRSGDLRAINQVATEDPQGWDATIRKLEEATLRQTMVDATTKYLFWQTLVSVWPLQTVLDAAGLKKITERLIVIMEKSIREAGSYTRWSDRNDEHDKYEEAVRKLVEGACASTEVRTIIRQYHHAMSHAIRANILGAVTVQLLFPGVPDTYQGCEVVRQMGVDPDNRELVNYAALNHRMQTLTAGRSPHDLDDQKMLVVSSALRLRRECPDAFSPDSTYQQVPTTSDHAYAFKREGRNQAVIAVVTRLAHGLNQSGGFNSATIALPPGQWINTLTGDVYQGGNAQLATMLADLPVAIMVRAPQQQDQVIPPQLYVSVVCARIHPRLNPKVAR